LGQGFICLSYPKLDPYKTHKYTVWTEHRVFNVKSGKDKGKVHPKTGHGDSEGEERYSCTLSLT